jgi:hypothetical protein
MEHEVPRGVKSGIDERDHDDRDRGGVARVVGAPTHAYEACSPGRAEGGFIHGLGALVPDNADNLRGWGNISLHACC